MLQPLLDALSPDRMTARRGAPSSCAICHMHHATCYAHSAGGCPVFRDASSFGGMTARRGAPSSCANASCTTLHIFPLCRWMPRIRDAGSWPAGATPVLSHRGNAICFTHSASGCPVSWRDDGSLGCTVELCNMQHHHATCYSHLRPAPCYYLCNRRTATSAPCYRSFRIDILLCLCLATATCVLTYCSVCASLLLFAY